MKVSEINNSSLNVINSESAIQMFHQRIQQLEEDRKEHSDDEKDILKTPNAQNTEEQEYYVKKLKNTLKVYKGRSKEFEKRR